MLSSTCGKLVAANSRDKARDLIRSIIAKANPEEVKKDVSGLRKRLYQLPSMPMSSMFMINKRSLNENVDFWVTVVLSCIKESHKNDNSDFYMQLARDFGELLKLKTVTLKNTKISDDEVVVLAHALSYNRTLTKLDLSQNNVALLALQVSLLRLNSTTQL